MARVNLIGKVFGRLTVIEEYGKDSSGHIIWKCKCECGNIKNCIASNLTNGKTKSCGCLRKENTIKQNIERSIDLTGQKFGKLTVIQKEITNKKGRNKYICICKCECGNISKVLYGDLVNGKTQSCGCAKSKGNSLINKILQENNYNFKREYKIVYNNNIYYYDFAILDDKNKIKCFIEFDGEQHYKYQKNTKGWNNLEHFQKVQCSDNNKNNYCKINNIKLVRIPYWDFDKITFDFLKERIVD